MRNSSRKNRAAPGPLVADDYQTMLYNPIHAGQVRYGLRQMKLVRKTGRRVARFNDLSQVPSYEDQALAIVERADFDHEAVHLLGRVQVANDDDLLLRGTPAVRKKEMKLEVLNRDGYTYISGRSCPPNSMILSAGMFKRLAASRIASALGASYRQ
jgi:hypothetical protein